MARIATAALLGLLLAILAPRAGSAEEAATRNADPRAGLDGLAGALEASMRAAGMAPAAGLWAATARGYHVPGVGAVFTLAARRLPSAPPTASAYEAARAVADATTALERTVSQAQDQAVRAELERSLSALRASRQALRVESSSSRVLVMIDERAVEREVRRLEEETERLRREAERAWAEADQAMQQAVLAPVAPAPPVPPVAAVPAPPVPPAPPLLLVHPTETPAPVQKALELQVSSAVVDVLEARAGALRLSPEESVVVAVDFLPRRVLWPAARPQRTIVVRVRQKDLDSRRQGRLSAEELRKRVEVAAY
jgi:hypothetical protein